MGLRKIVGLGQRVGGHELYVETVALPSGGRLDSDLSARRLSLEVAPPGVEGMVEWRFGSADVRIAVACSSEAKRFF